MGVDVTDMTRKFTSDDWDKFCAYVGHTIVYQRRNFLSGRGSRGGRDNRGGHGGRGGRGGPIANCHAHPASTDVGNVAAANVTDIVE